MRCPSCHTEVPPSRRSCPVCQTLIHADELKRLAREAEEAEAVRPADALAAWRRTLDLLPAESGQARAIAGRIDGLSRRVEQEGGGAAVRGIKKLGSVWKSGGGLVAAGLLIWKLKAVLLFLLTKAKLLLLGFTKIGTVSTMALSLGVYWTVFGWQLALGLILSIYIHEMGHVAALRRFGIPASAPMFIPGIGAFVRMKQRPANSREDARVGLAGPIWGLAAALAAWGIHLAGGGPIWAAIARLGAWINLFNLLPFGPLDGGRGFSALSRWQRLAAAGVIGAAWAFTREGLLILLLIAAAFWLFVPRRAEDEAGEGDGVALAQYAGLVVILSALCLIPVPGMR
jgi:Zn-dependent protease